MQFTNLTEVIQAKRMSDRGITFVTKQQEDDYSYGELLDKAQGVLYVLQEKGLRAGDELIFQLDDNIQFICFFWACLLGGIIPVPITVGNSKEHRLKLLRIYETLKGPYLVATRETFDKIELFCQEEQLQESLERLKSTVVFVEEAAEPAGKGRIRVARPKDTAMIQFSSGSTGNPKGVMLTHENLICNINAILSGGEVTEADSCLSWMPLTHDMGLIGMHLSALAANIHLYLMPTAQFIFEPTLWMQKTHQHRITLLSSPNFGYRHFLEHYKADHLGQWDLSAVRLIFNGAEPISAAWSERFLRELKPCGLRENAMFPVYGMAEASLAVTFPPVHELLTPVYLDRKTMLVGKAVQEAAPTDSGCVAFVDVGCPVDHCSVRICNDDGLIVQDWVVGNIQIKGRNVTTGYYNDPEETNRLFTQDGWLCTGDVGFIRNNRLVVTGRKKDIIFIRGQNVYPHDLEEAAQSLDGIELGKVAVCGVPCAETGMDEIVVFTVFRGKTEKFVDLAVRLKKWLNKSTGVDIAHVVPVKTIPKTTSGKLQRYKLIESYERGEFSEVIQAIQLLSERRMEEQAVWQPENEWEEQLSALWKEVLGLKHISLHADFFELGGDSLKAAILLNRIHQTFGIEIPVKHLYQVSTLKKLADYMQNSEIRGFEPIARAESRSHYPLSPSQYRVYVQEQMGGLGTSYNMPFVIHIAGVPDIPPMKRAFEQIMRDHAVLRTSFAEVEGEIVQIVHDEAELVFETMHGDEAELPALMERFVRPFDLHAAPLFRVGLIACAADRHHLVLDMHHTISDGISIGKLTEQFMDIMQGKEAERPNLQYVDYVLWREQRALGETMQKHKAYWLRQLSGELPPLEMPTDYKRTDIRTFAGETIDFRIPPEIAATLQRVARRQETTLNTALIALYGTLLSKYSRQQEIMIGSLTAGRNHADLSSMLGMFVHYIPLRIRVKPDTAFIDFLRECDRTISDAYEHQDYPYEELVAALPVKTPPGRNPLFDTMLIFHNQMEMGRKIALGDAEFTFEEWRTKTSKLDFKLDVYLAGDGGLHCVLEYNVQLFNRETIDRFVSHFCAVVHHVADNPHVKLQDISMLSEQERDQLLLRFNDTKRDYPREMLLHQWFESRARLEPERRAVLFGDDRLAYGELNEKANRLARVLQARGLGPNRIAAIAVERSPEMMIGILAILKAGAAYLPIAPDYPQERIDYMLEDSKADLVLTNRRWTHLFHSEFVIDLHDEACYQGNSDPVPTEATAQDVAYVIYTSGSTGKPKGVMVEHSAVVNRIHWMQKQYPLGPEDVILQKTPFTFDVSVWELFWWSVAGSSVCFLEPGAEKDPSAIVRAIARHRVTTIHFVPSMLHLFLNELERQRENAAEPAAGLGSLRDVFASGEALPVQHAERFYRIFASSSDARTRLINLYGPTEAAIDVTFFECEAGALSDPMPIGKPIDNIQLYILDGENRLQPVGQPGELCIAGVGLARGYLNRPELTAEKFAANPFVPGTRMYRTGDLAKWLPDGSIAYMGRLDHQVKLRGYRVELGEVEAALLQVEDIAEAVVAVKEAADGDKQLHAYVAAKRDVPAAEIRKMLARTLPEYMIPAYYTRVGRMPLTPSGKADRHALMQLQGTVSANSGYVAPQNEVEHKLAGIWEELLHLDRVGTEDHFFDLGGHSLKATQLLHTLNQEFQTDIQLRDIFNKPTIRQLAAIIAEKGKAAYEPIPLAGSRDVYPLSSAQNRLYILERLEEVGCAYHLPAALIIEGAADESRLEQALQSLLSRHEILRTTFESVEGVPMQRIHARVSFSIERMEGDELSIEDIISAFIRPFDLSSAPLLRVGLVQLPHDRQLLLFDMHHLISDGVSMGVLTHEFMQLYERKEPPALKVQYKDFAAWQPRFLASEPLRRQERYWLELFADGAPLLNLPTDFKRPLSKTYEGGRLAFDLNAGETHRLKALAAASNATLYMVLLAVFNILLSKYAGQEDVVVGSPVSGRPHADLNHNVGMFVNTIVLRNRPAKRLPFAQFLRQLRETTLEAFQHQHYPFEELVAKLKLARDPSRNPLFDVMFIMQNMEIPELTMDRLRVKPVACPAATAKFDLTLEVSETGDGIACHFEYGTQLFKRETIETLARHFGSILREVLENPQITLGDIEMISAEERERILLRFNDTACDYPRDQALHRWLEEQADLGPDRLAIMSGDARVTYGELNAKANQLARLLQACGLGPNRIAAIAAERSPEMMVGIMAILKAGGAYLPIAPDLPPERIDYMLEDSKACLLLTQKRRMHAFESAAASRKIIDLDDERHYQGDDSNISQSSAPHDLAYVIYTSGSTGKPKGVMVEHAAVVNRIHWMQKRFPLERGDVILQKTAITFDVSVWELFWWSLAGATVSLLQPGGEKNPETLLRTVAEHQVTVMHFVPSMLHLFMDYVELFPEYAEHSGRRSSLRYVFVSGEALAVQHVQRFYGQLGSSGSTQLVNLYGPTEAAIDVSCFVCEAGTDYAAIPIGRPIDNIRLYVVDEERRLLPVGLTGELCIAGAGLARGYINRPELTAERFVNNPFAPGTRMYRTGDLAKWLPDGTIEYRGRMDDQVKLRGYRIELGEIEATLTSHPDISEAVALAKELADGDRRLCAYFTAKRELTVVEIRSHLSQTLPDYMIPAYFTLLETMPLTANGKADRRTLMKLEQHLSAQPDYVAPQNETEGKLADIWRELLNLDRVGTQDHFFDIGGNSLLLLRMHAKLQTVYPDRIKVTDLFAYPTIEKLAAYLRTEALAANREAEVRYIGMPEDFFAAGGGQQAGAMFKIELDADVSALLMSMGEQLRTDLLPILASIYLYLFAQYNKKAEQSIQLMPDDRNIYALTLDFSGIRHVEALVRTIEKKIQESKARGEGAARARRSARPPENALAAFFYKKSPLVRSKEWLACCDLLFSYEEDRRRIVIHCEYDAKRLNKEKIRQFVLGYGKLARWFANQYATQAQVAATRGGGKE